ADPGRQPPRTLADLPSATPESKALSRELKQRGFRFTGPVTVYSTMQACGIVDDHLADCFRRDAYGGGSGRPTADGWAGLALVAGPSSAGGWAGLAPLEDRLLLVHERLGGVAVVGRLA